MDETNSNGKRSMKEKLQEITGQLQAGVKELFESDRYREYLTCMSKFHNYSLNNTILIAMQKPDATLVAGYSAWQKNHDRTVRKGEKGIKIIAPTKYKVEIEDEQNPGEMKTIERTGFRVTHVFDVSQTEGKELPSIAVNELSGDVVGYHRLFDALRDNCPVRMQFETIEGGAKGYYNDADKHIGIREGMSQVQTVKTMIHEMAHQRLHSREAMDPEHPMDHRTKEVEAESIAYAVCQRYGLDTSEYSFGYIAGWSSGKEVTELRTSLERIQSTADELIKGIDKSLEKKLKREQEKSSRVAERGAY